MDDSHLKIKFKIQDLEEEVRIGRKFASTEYVRDYIQRPQVYRVNYE